MKTPYLSIERPDAAATVDFLEQNTRVLLTVDPATGILSLNVRVSDSEQSSYFRDEEFTVNLTP